MVGITYEDFLDLEYDPDGTALVCEFCVEPAADQSPESAASRVASESSNGTWAELQVEGSVTDLSATACAVEEATVAGRTDRDGYRVTVAYPDALFEPGNVPQVLSCIAGNILGMKAVDRIRLQDCVWPEPLAASFPGPQFGTDVRTEIFDAGDRPITATVPKPKVGLSTDQHAQIGYEAWTGGLDLLKDDENRTDQSFNPFEDRLTDSLAMRDRARVARLCGVDQIHTGTADLGKLANEDTVGINEWLYADLHGLRDVLPMASGGPSGAGPRTRRSLRDDQRRLGRRRGPRPPRRHPRRRESVARGRRRRGRRARHRDRRRGDARTGDGTDKVWDRDATVGVGSRETAGAH